MKDARVHLRVLVDCRPIVVARDVAAAGFRIEREDKRKLPVPLRIARATVASVRSASSLDVDPRRVR